MTAFFNKRTILATALCLALISPTGCDGGSGSGNEDVMDSFWFPQPKKDTKTETDGGAGDVMDALPGPDGEIIDEPIDDIVQDLPDQPPIDIIEQDLPPQEEVDTATPLDIDENYIEERPSNYPYQTYGPMTISMKGLVIGGQYVQMRMAELSYWKVPSSRWEYLMDMIKEAGFNGLYTSACWAMHEPTAGAADFQSGNLDLAQYLQMAQDKGLYVYFAAGPWVDGEAGGCLPDWVTAAATAQPSPMADQKYAIRVTDADYQAAAGLFLDQVNGIVAQYQVTSFPQGPVVFYQMESNYDSFYFLQDAQAKIMQEILGTMTTPLNPGLYMSQLRDSIQADGITVPLVTSITGDFENGGRHILGTGDAPGVYPAVDMTTETTYEAMELKLWHIRKEMREESLHGQIYTVMPGVAVGVLPSATHMARMLMAGADVVVVKDFVATVLPAAFAPVGINKRGWKTFAELDEAMVAFDTNRKDFAAPISLSGLPRRTYFAFKQLNSFMERFGAGIASKDLILHSGPNKSISAFLDLYATNPAVGAIEDKFEWPMPGPASGIIEFMSDHFKKWYQVQSEPTGRATYFTDTTDGTIVVHLMALDEIEDDENKHDRQDLITKLNVNGDEIPRHSNIIVPASDDVATGREFLGWGSKFVILNHPLGPGYPLIEYASANLWTIRQFNNRMLIVAHGKPTVKSNGVYFTEPGEISFANFGGIPDVVHNDLPGGNIHTDPGGKIAVQFQHESTGSMLITLPGGKQLMLLVTTSDLARTAWFGKDAMGYDVAVFGFDRVDSFEEGEEGTSILGVAAPSREKFFVLTDTKPYDIEAGDQSVDCEYLDLTGMLSCTATPDSLPSEEIGHSGLYMGQESYSGSISGLGTDEYPNDFATLSGYPVGLQDPQIAAGHGVGWYATQVEIGAVQPTFEGFLALQGAGDIISVFINDTYVGSSSPVGNAPMGAPDAASGMPSAGFRIPAGIVTQGTNTVAVRVVALGRSLASTPLFYSSAPLLPPELDGFASAMPHLAVEGLNVAAQKGIWGPAKLTVGAMSVPLAGTWYVSKGDGTRMLRTRGMLKNWHNLATSPGAPGGQGFSSINDITPESPLMLQDGQITWLTTTFSSDSLVYEGGLDLALEGKSTVGLIFLNGECIGPWFSDEESLSQGLHSRLPQGTGTRQLLADLSHGNAFSSSPERVMLPDYLLNESGGQDNRVTAMILDISPALDVDLVLPALGTVQGAGSITRFDVVWNRDEAAAGDDDPGGNLLRSSVELHLLKPPQPEQ